MSQDLQVQGGKGANSSTTSSFVKLPVMGGNGGDTWDDGVFGRVRKVYVGSGKSCVGYIQFVYDKNGKLEPLGHGLKPDKLDEFVLHPNEYITSVEGTVKYVDLYSRALVTSLTFKTSMGRTSKTYGFAADNEFVIENNGCELVGFHGRAGDALDALGAYSSILSSSGKLSAQGGNGGETWDDGAFDAIRKVYVGNGKSWVGYIKIVYEKGGKQEIREHGIKLDEPEEFSLDPYEYITSVEGTCGYIARHWMNRLVSSLTFETSKARTSPTFGFVPCFSQRFVLEDKGRALVGFCGRSGDAINALGAYSAICPFPIKFPAIGGNGGDKWDDGVYNRVRKVYVGEGIQCVGYVKFVYDKGGELETREHGTKRDKLQEFELDPDEYITSVEGTYSLIRAYHARLVTSLTFKTSTGRTSPTFGTVNNAKFVFEHNGCEIVGFHGRGGEVLDALGAYVLLGTNTV